MDEVSCRICRGEGSTDDPLYFPCKCRGSIKYIHQDCLMDWLRHSNNNAQRCDICNEPYKFKTLFDPETPTGLVPLGFLLSRIFRAVEQTATMTLSILLYLTLVVIQVPLWWKVVSRLCSWVIDGRLPQTTIFLSFLFGQLDLEALSLPSSPLATLYHLVTYTYSSGLISVLICVMGHVFLFIDHEWVTRDEGYFKLLTRHIGNEPRRQLGEMIAQHLRDLEHDPEENIRNILNVLEGMDGQLEAQAAIRAFVREAEQPEEQPQEQPEEEPRLVPAASAAREARGRENLEGSEPETWSDMEDVADLDSSDDSTEAEPTGRYVRRRVFEPEPAARVLPRPVRIADQPLPPPVRPADQGPIAPPANDPDFPEVPDEPPLDFPEGNFQFTLGLNLTTPLKTAFLADLVILVYLFVFYLLPSLTGKMLFTAGVFGFRWMCYVGSKLQPSALSFLSFDDSTGLLKHLEHATAFLASTSSNIATGHLPVTTTERVIPLVLFYTVFLSTLNLYMTFLRRGYGATHPLPGDLARKMYKLLFELISTLKVFLIFNIELIFFPVFCGWLLDFTTPPLFSPAGLIVVFGVLVPLDLDGFFAHPLLRMLLYWAMGTCYMYVFATFIGMTRSCILRPGVLFFIRSPDDPNARLIYDALMRPLRLQLWRICMSGSIYLGLIVFGIGGLTWLSCLALPRLFLPLTGINLTVVVVAALIFLKAIAPNEELIKASLHLFWKKAFVIACQQTRLSSFILNIPNPTERGYVTYRTPLHRLFGSGPDYANPMLYQLALEAFRTTNVSAVFIPDGNWIRAPGCDGVSRRFLRKLFVAVTKNDQLLTAPKPIPAYLKDDDYECEDEIVDSASNVYTTVYQPPRFRARILLMVGYLSVFGFGLALGLLLMALALGRPLVVIFSLVTKRMGVESGVVSRLFHPEADAWSVLVGVLIELWCLCQLEEPILDAHDLEHEHDHHHDHHDHDHDHDRVHDHDVHNQENEHGHEHGDPWEEPEDEAGLLNAAAQVRPALHMFKLLVLFLMVLVSGFVDTLLAGFVYTYAFGASSSLTVKTLGIHIILLPVMVLPTLRTVLDETSFLMRHGVIENNLTEVSVYEFSVRLLRPVVERIALLMLVTAIVLGANDFFTFGSVSVLRIVQRAVSTPEALTSVCQFATILMIALLYLRLAVNYVRGVNEEVKNEVYARGKMLENLEE